MGLLEDGLTYVENIKGSGLSIYNHIEVGHPKYWIPSPELEAVLNYRLSGLDLSGLALRTRSKKLKEAVCTALGYPLPKSFKKVQPRFPGQNFDTYGQQANNLQVWNEELSPTRRYVIAQIQPDGHIGKIRVVAGDTLALLDTTGTLTQKYQARLIPSGEATEQLSEQDTIGLLPHINDSVDLGTNGYSPIMPPRTGQLLSVSKIFTRVSTLLGQSFADRGITQERNRGADLHRLVCNALNYTDYADNGQFPDIRHQLLEVKLQTSPTIDLGLVTPDSCDELDTPMLGEYTPRHCDVRYCIFYGSTDGTNVTISNIYVTTGADFFSRFQRFEGRVLNKKIQMHLPPDFFN